MGPYGNPSSPTYSYPVLDIGGMLSLVPDNTANQISARNVRDVIGGLYDNILQLSASFSIPPSVTFSYTNLNPSTVRVGGLATQYTFNNESFTSILNRMLYPYTPPTFSFQILPSVIEYGNSSATVTIFWEINSTKNGVINAYIQRPLQQQQNVSPPLAPFNSTMGILSSNLVNTNVVTTFTFSVDDTDYSVFPTTGTLYQTTVTVTWNLARFWGTLPSSNALTSVSTVTFSSSDISLLSYDLLSGFTQSRSITTNGDYVVFIWPNNAVDLSAFPPVMKVNGLPNNDWTKTRDNVVFTNQFGYTASYDVWRFNSIQPSYTLEYVIT